MVDLLVPIVFRVATSKIRPKGARIVAIVDAYDALTHDRVYRPAMSEEEALTILRDGSEKQFDPVLLATFFRRLPETRRLCRQNADPSSGRRRPPQSSSSPPPTQLPVWPTPGPESLAGPA